MGKAQEMFTESGATLTSGSVPVCPFPGFDRLLGRMKSTGKAPGRGDSFAEAFAKVQWSGLVKHCPLAGCAFISVREDDKRYVGWTGPVPIDYWASKVRGPP